MFQRNKHLMDSLSKQQQRYGLLLLRKDTQPRTKTTIADQTRQLRQTASRANSTAKNGSVTLLRQPAWTGRLSENILQVYYIVLTSTYETYSRRPVTFNATWLCPRVYNRRTTLWLRPDEPGQQRTGGGCRKQQRTLTVDGRWINRKFNSRHADSLMCGGTAFLKLSGLDFTSHFELRTPAVD